MKEFLDFIIHKFPLHKHLEMQEERETVKGITIYDLSGRLIYKGTKTTVSLSDLPNGVYLLKLDTDEGLISKKIIKRS